MPSDLSPHSTPKRLTGRRRGRYALEVPNGSWRQGVLWGDSTVLLAALEL
jgi:hypothetical protein